MFQESHIPDVVPTVLHEFFERAAAKHPSLIAIDVPPGDGRPRRQTITYSELKTESDKIAAGIAHLSCPDALVAILLGRDTPTLYAAQVGVLKTGMAYVGIDPSFPDAHIRKILDDASPAAILTDTCGSRRLGAAGILIGEIIDVSRPGDRVYRPLPRPDLHDLAYVIYTSGTTGIPKGVLIEHRSIANLIQADLREFQLGPGDRVAQGSSSAYDSSVEETWLALSSGATLVALDDETVRSGPDLADWLQKEKVTVFCPPPTLLRSMGCRNPEAELPDLRILYVGGEALTPDVAAPWSVGKRLINGYGPTECTVTCLRTDIGPGDAITIGKPVDGSEAWVLNDLHEPIARGELGELCMGGECLARGYHNHPDLTAEKFIEHPALGRLYRTGDLARLEPNGSFSYHGRIDSQVKLRGYRIELEAIETCLARQPGVLEVACRVQEDDGGSHIAAHIVPADPASPPDFTVLANAVASELPRYAVPSLYGLVTVMPKTVSGKLLRDQLPVISLDETSGRQELVAPRNQMEAALAEAFRETLRLKSPISVLDNFFIDLGGSSLTAAQLVSRLRDNPETASVTVRDIYDAPTVAELAVRITEASLQPAPSKFERAEAKSPLIATIIQSGWLSIELLLGSAAAYLVAFLLLPFLASIVQPWTLVLLFPLLAAIGASLYATITVLAAAAIKRILIGKYRPGRYSAWGQFHVRNWIVVSMVRRIPWALFEGTELAPIALRALGAKIGKGVHFHRGSAPLNGGWDLLEIGDEVTLSQECSLRLVELEAGELVCGPIVIDNGAVVGVRASVGHSTSIQCDGHLTDLSSLTSGDVIPAAEEWSGIPAQCVGASDVRVSLQDPFGSMSPGKFAALLTGCRALVGATAIAPALALTAVVVANTSVFSILDSSSPLSVHVAAVFVAISIWAAASLVISLGAEALLCRALGKVKEGTIPLNSPAYARVWLKTGLVDSANRWLSGTLFWPVWLRAAGMQIGKGCEISTIIDVVPELVKIGDYCFFADGIYVGPPAIRRGVVTLKSTVIGHDTFIGNHAVIPSGLVLPPSILLGVCTVADDQKVRAGTGWFGHPSFELPRREIVECDRALTHHPPPIRYWNRVFWEMLRAFVPSGPAIALAAWYIGISMMTRETHELARGIGATMLATLAASGGLVTSVLALKWMLLGRARPGTHALWSCWCSRWDYLYVVWGEWARPVLSTLEGTILLHPFLRLMGMRVGKRALLSDGFAQVVDPDMIEIGDGATVSALFQAHTFEDRVLKIDKVKVGKGSTLGPGTVPLYGAEIGEGAIVAPNSVVMKHERLLPGMLYEGSPTQLLVREAAE